MIAARPWHEELVLAAPGVFGPVEPAFGRLLRGYSHVAKIQDERGRKHWIALREDRTLDVWAEISLLVDHIIPEHVLAPPGHGDRGVRLDDPRLVTLHYAAFNPAPIDPERWRRRYPDVPHERAVEFVMWHELGHAVRGASEMRADAYAREKLGLPAVAEGSAGGGTCVDQPLPAFFEDLPPKKAGRNAAAGARATRRRW